MRYGFPGDHVSLAAHLTKHRDLSSVIEDAHTGLNLLLVAVFPSVIPVGRVLEVEKCPEAPLHGVRVRILLHGIER